MKLLYVNGVPTVAELGRILFQSTNYDEAVEFFNAQFDEPEIQEYDDEGDDEDFDLLSDLCE